jgi:hypothetical protein
VDLPKGSLSYGSVTSKLPRNHNTRSIAEVTIAHIGMEIRVSVWMERLNPAQPSSDTPGATDQKGAPLLSRRTLHPMDLDKGMSKGTWLLLILLAMGGILLAMEAQASGQTEGQNYVFLR